MLQSMVLQSQDTTERLTELKVSMSELKGICFFVVVELRDL